MTAEIVYSILTDFFEDCTILWHIVLECTSENFSEVRNPPPEYFIPEARNVIFSMISRGWVEVYHGQWNCWSADHEVLLNSEQTRLLLLDDSLYRDPDKEQRSDYICVYVTELGKNVWRYSADYVDEFIKIAEEANIAQ